MRVAGSKWMLAATRRRQTGSSMSAALPPHAPLQKTAGKAKYLSYTGRGIYYDSFNQVVSSSSVIIPLLYSGFFSPARSPQAYSPSGRIFPDFVQASFA